MIVIIKSAPDTEEAKRAVRLAGDLAADIVLLQNAVWLAEEERLEGFCGTAYVLDEDLKLRGVPNVAEDIKTITYEELIDLMAENDKVIGML